MSDGEDTYKDVIEDEILDRLALEGRKPRLRLAPIGLKAANKFVDKVHRHHGPTRGHKFSVSVVDELGATRGVAIAGRPVARMLDDGAHLEVLRLATDGTKDACSMLYGAAARAAVGMGYARQSVLTYILASESGASLRAAGWVEVSASSGGTWDRPTRTRVDHHPMEPKRRFHAAAPT